MKDFKVVSVLSLFLFLNFVFFSSCCFSFVGSVFPSLTWTWSFLSLDSWGTEPSQMSEEVFSIFLWMSGWINWWMGGSVDQWTGGSVDQWMGRQLQGGDQVKQRTLEQLLGGGGFSKSPCLGADDTSADSYTRLLFNHSRFPTRRPSSSCPPLFLLFLWLLFYFCLLRLPSFLLHIHVFLFYSFYSVFSVLVSYKNIFLFNSI